MLEGEVCLEYGDGQPGCVVTPGHPGLLLPEQPHWVTPLEPMSMQVDFYDGHPNLQAGSHHEI